VATSERLRRYAEGSLPTWTEASEGRRGHMERVATLLGEWAAGLGLEETDRLRWRATGWLHDTLRDAPPSLLRAELGDGAADLPDALLHGPAAAVRLEGEIDEEMRHAIRYHTTGHAAFGALGRSLYIADFLEPGREGGTGWRAALRARLPREELAVLREVLRARIIHQMELNRPLRAPTVGFWNVSIRDRGG